jgi:hypothetical protein
MRFVPERFFQGNDAFHGVEKQLVIPKQKDKQAAIIPLT